MRTTIDIPDVVHMRIKALATERAVSMSVLAGELVARGLESVDQQPVMEFDNGTGLPLLRVGREVTTAEILEFLADSE